MKLKVSVSKTSDGGKDDLQIMSDDLFTINIVLLAEEILIEDSREAADVP